MPKQILHCLIFSRQKGTTVVVFLLQVNFPLQVLPLTQGFFWAPSGRIWEAPSLQLAEFLSKNFEFFGGKSSFFHTLSNKNQEK